MKKGIRQFGCLFFLLLGNNKFSHLEPFVKRYILLSRYFFQKPFKNI